MSRSEYTGETSRTGYLRGREHLEGLSKKNEDNPLWKHCVVAHDGEVVDFKMKIVRRHKTPLTRQIHEAVEIQYSTAAAVLNSKGEWNGARIPRIVIEVGEEIKDEDKEEIPRKQKKFWQEKVEKKTAEWRVQNLKKRKRCEHECGIAEPDFKTPKIEFGKASMLPNNTECGMAEPDGTECGMSEVWSKRLIIFCFR